MRLKHSMDDDRQYGPSMNRGMGHPHGTPDFEGERAKIESLANQATEYRDGMLQSVRGDETLTPDQIQAREGAINDSYNEYMGGLRGEYDRISAEEAAYYAENGYDSGSYAGENGYAYEDDGMGNAGYDTEMGNSDYGYEADGMGNAAYSPDGYGNDAQDYVDQNSPEQTYGQGENPEEYPDLNAPGTPYEQAEDTGNTAYGYDGDGMSNAGYDAGMGNSDYGYEDDGMSNAGYDAGSYDPGSHESEGMGNTGYGYGGDGDTGYTSGESSGQDVGSGMDM